MNVIKKMLVASLALLLVLIIMAPMAEASVHTIKRGETLWQIARNYQTTVAALAKANNLGNVNVIYAGQKLTLPAGKTAVAASSYTVRPGDTLWLISQRYNTTVAELQAVNNIARPDHIEAGQVIKLTPAQAAGAPVIPARSSAAFSAAELDLLARLVHSESEGEPFQGQVAVAASVLNRMRSSLYPNTVTAVINQVVNGFYQYSPVLDGRINRPATDSARRAVKEAIDGADPSLGATGFYNPRKTSNKWVRNQPVTTTIGNHVFFR